MRALKFLLIGIIAANFIYNPETISAQTDFNQFWTKFKSVIVKNDKNAVANLSKLPVSMPYGMKSVKTKPEFLRGYNKIFYDEADAAKCFETSKVQKVSANRYEIACRFRKDKTGDGGEPFVYAFELTKNGWKFVSFDNINE